ncbi:hypothetical protein L207DRAFT_591311 [Hyaloscypha variabilis F]|uniref:Uncharacterized protein n=1 Tax=Hyaloscypha variabilis (strain UAMH 11265 / GT02V1 / F) TaxID=1149755 RepID=A0A2J6R047_HYAVF|nr:hypothetical protein L207DRAFT_591311 [Hyaloscypha variabilis F]
MLLVLVPTHWYSLAAVIWYLGGFPNAAPDFETPTFQIATLDPNWSSCIRKINALHDPNTALSTADGFYPVTSHKPVPVFSQAPSAAPSISQVLATRTRPPMVDSTTTLFSDPSAVRSTTSAVKNFPSTQISRAPAVITIKTATITANPASEFIIGGQTLSSGKEITYFSTVLSLATDARILDIGGTSIQTLDYPYMVGTQPLSAGGPVVVASGITYSLAPDSSSIVIDGTTEAAESPTQLSNTEIQKIWVPGHVIGSQTLVAGGLPVTSSGTVLSLEPDGESIVIIFSKTEDINAWLGSPTQSETTSNGISTSDQAFHEDHGSSTSQNPTRTTKVPADMRNDVSRVMLNVYTMFLLSVIAVIEI